MSTDGRISAAVATVEAELSAFWAAATDAQGARKARASTLNFIAISVPSEIDSLRTSVDELAETHAGRVFLVTLDGRLPPWELETNVSAVCRGDRETVVCYDRIELNFGAMAAPRAPSVLAALALPEIPVVVELARGAPAPLADALLRVADRVIVDAAHTNVARLAEMARKSEAPMADRAFVRAFSWRELTARFFDEAPGAERCIGRVEVDRGPLERGDPAALLLGWLASRLGWHFESATRALDAEGMPIPLAVRVVEGVPAGEIAAVRLVTAWEGRPLFCACERKPGERTVRWSMEGPRSVRHEHPLGFRDESWVLRKTIDATEGDRIYREAVLAAADWGGAR